MAGELHIGNDQFQYIARISHGKDSLKMLDVIVSRGLRLDRITTTDIWATRHYPRRAPQDGKIQGNRRRIHLAGSIASRSSTCAP